MRRFKSLLTALAASTMILIGGGNVFAQDTQSLTGELNNCSVQVIDGGNARLTCYDESGTNVLYSASLNGDTTAQPAAETPTYEEPETGFQPGTCRGVPRLPYGFNGPFTDEVTQALNIRVGDSPQGDEVRIGSECAAWHAGIGRAALFSVTCPRDITVDGYVYSGFLCQIGVGSEGDERIYWGNNQRVKNARHITIRWVGDPETGTYPFGTWVYDCSTALEESNRWGRPSVDKPSFTYTLVECPGLVADDLGTRQPADPTNDGGTNNSLASLHCDSPEAAADWINQHATGKGKVKASDLSHPPARGGGTYSNGWSWPYAGRAPVNVNLDTLGWYQIDYDGGSIQWTGSTGPIQGGTFWCRP